MYLDMIVKLCKMINGSYDIMASCVDEAGKAFYISEARQYNENRIELYRKELKCILERCLNEKDIHISINEISVTWISIPIINQNNLQGYLIVGPFFSNHLNENVLMDAVDRMHISKEDKQELLSGYKNLSCYSYVDYIKIIKFAYLYLYDQQLDESRITIINGFISDEIDDVNEASNRSIEVEVHGTYLYERYLVECIRLGEVDKLQKLLKSGFPGKAGILNVSNELRNLKNMFIVAVTLATRAAIEGGLNSEVAYTISDIYIRQLEIMNTIPAEYSHRIFLDFARRVRELNKIKGYSPYVNQCCEYIKMHVGDNILVSTIAEHLNLSLEHLSRIFKQETGITIVDYVRKVKIKEAKFLLKYTDATLVEVSERLAFSSQSHFNSVFKSEMSVTPKQYRDKVKIAS